MSDNRDGFDNGREPSQLRSQRWLAVPTLRGFGHRSRMQQLGFDSAELSGRPVIAILNTWSDLASCHAHFRERAQHAKRGVWQAGGTPIEIPVQAVAEAFQKPSSMMYRNLLALETEEVLRSYPIDGAILMGGCDKTTPGLLMGAISMDIPALFLPAGPMLRGRWRGKVLGSGTDAWRYWTEKRAGLLDDQSWAEIEEGIARSAGHCMTMGTASTMTAAAETLGFALPGSTSIPAVDSDHIRMAIRCGRRAVEIVREGLRPSTILSRSSFDNAIRTTLALGGSTNAVIHIIALARRAGIDLALERFDELARETPVLANIAPAGEFLMEDFYYAGGLTGLHSRIRELLDLDCLTVSGGTLGANLAGATVHNDSVIRPIDDPIRNDGGVAILRGSLAPNGAVIKVLAASPHLLKHVGPALVFDDCDELERQIDDPELDVSADTVLILRNAGPVGGPGMPEWGMLPIPSKLLRAGVRDMVRISDARMSGTSYGTCVLHVTPEAAVGGPLSLVKTGDLIEIDVDARRLDVRLSEAELQQRRLRAKRREPNELRGYLGLYTKHVNQADMGCDFDFLSAAGVTQEPAIH